MAYCKVSQAEIYYEDLGEGTPIIMIHGYSPDHRLMSGCMEPIFAKRDGWRRIYIDLPGMGVTKKYNHISSSDEMLDAVLDFIHAIIPEQQYLIVGESYGGYLARGIVQKHQEQLLGAAFICPVIIPTFKADFRYLFPFFIFVDFLLLALSFWPGTNPAHEHKCERIE